MIFARSDKTSEETDVKNVDLNMERMEIERTVNMRSPDYSPSENPFIQGTEVRTKHKTVRTRTSPRDLMDPETGEVVGQSIIHIIEERDEQQFVKVFADGVKAAFDLTRTGHKVFQIVLEAYQREKMTGGYADAVTLFWFGDGLDGRAVGIGERTFERGLKELVQKGFLWHKRPNEFWVNPALFFKGDRVAFLREYRRKPALPASDAAPPLPSDAQ